MKKFFIPFMSLFLFCSISAVYGQTKPSIESIYIESVSTNLRGAAVVLGQIDISAPEAGRVVVQFNGQCVSSPGDRIILAASNTNNWGTNDGNTSVEAYDNDVNTHSFSHTRVYDVTAGNHSFYAVGQNYVETAGTGVASVYGTLTVKFFPTPAVPNSSLPVVEHVGIVDINRNVRGSTQSIESIDLDAPTSGTAVVRFDGICVSSPGDLIILAASNTSGWSVNDGNTETEAIDSDLNTRTFSHTRVYSVNSGINTFYAVAQNYVETAGSGIVSLYASLTVEFYPSVVDPVEHWPFTVHEGVNKTNVNVEGGPYTMGQVTFDAPESGKVWVTYDGLCASNPGDRILMAASNTASWGANSGHVSAEAISADLIYNGFSHTRVYDVNAGSHTFYAVAQNYVETSGNGLASNYGSLTATFYPDDNIINTGVKNLVAIDNEINVYPNPTSGLINVRYSGNSNEKFNIDIIDITGKTMYSIGEYSSNQLQSLNINLNDFPSGMYFFRMQNGSKIGVKEIIKE